MSDFIISGVMQQSDEMKAYWEDSRWSNEHGMELAKYEGKWTAIVDKQIAAIANSWKAAEEEASRKTGRKQIVVVFNMGSRIPSIDLHLGVSR